MKFLVLIAIVLVFVMMVKTTQAGVIQLGLVAEAVLIAYILFTKKVS